MTNNIDQETVIPNTGAQPLYISLSLLVIFVLSIVFIAYVIVTHESASPVAEVTDNTKQFLIDANPQKTPNNNPIKDMPSWILILITGFCAIQTLPILVAAAKAKKRQLTAITKRQIMFLCETPMYLGLLGSLLGVCLTQFMTGSLSAPLAYITTIVGILLHLFAKFTIVVPLPGAPTPDIAEEV
ncbi:MAG: hypothetical protein ACUZ8H_02445 [Candidatus Anammoxibacter sp.]